MPVFDENIEVVDKNKVIRIRLGIDADNKSFFSLNDKEGFERLIFYLDKEGNGSIGFRTASGQPTVSLGTSSELGSGMMILDAENENTLTIRIKNGVGQIHLDTKQGIHSWPTPCT
jgi:hypothetical protein